MICKGFKKEIHVDTKKKPGIIILMSDRVDVRARKIVRDKEEHHIIMESIIQEDVTVFNVHAPIKGHENT